MNPDARTPTNALGFYKQQQAEISRRRLYPVTAFYTTFSIIMLMVATQTARPFVAAAFFLAGIPVWTLVEYLFHRYILHGRFKHSKKWYKKFYTGLCHKYLDPLHWEHHERPTDGLHISGELKDLLPLFAVALPVSFIFPAYTAPMLLAGAIQSYVAEEWIHHSLHFYNFRNPYFRYIKGYHLYHHSSHGITTGFGITNGFWDIIFRTRFPEKVQRKLSGQMRLSNLTARNKRPDELNVAARRFQA